MIWIAKWYGWRAAWWQFASACCDLIGSAVSVVTLGIVQHDLSAGSDLRYLDASHGRLRVIRATENPLPRDP